MGNEYLDPGTHNVPLSQLYADVGATVIGTASGLFFLCLLAVIARFAASRKGKIALWWDDWLCIPSLVFALGLSFIDIAIVQYGGVGRHLDSLRAETLEIEVNFLKILFAGLLVYSFAIPLPRLGILFLYIRLFSKPSPTFTFILYGVAGLIALWCPVVFFLEVFGCSPIAFAWDKSIVGGKCFTEAKLLCRYIAIPIVLYDIALLILPLPIIWQLQSTLKQKIALSGIFVTGSLGLVASVIRLLIFFRADAYEDTTWGAVDLVIWNLVEVDAVLIAACLPRLKPLFKWFWESTGSIRSKLAPSAKQNPSISFTEREFKTQRPVPKNYQSHSPWSEWSEESSENITMPPEIRNTNEIV